MLHHFWFDAEDEKATLSYLCIHHTLYKDHYSDAAWTVDTDHVWFMDSCCLILTHHLRSSRNHQTRLQFSL